MNFYFNETNYQELLDENYEESSREDNETIKHFALLNWSQTHSSLEGVPETLHEKINTKWSWITQE